MFKLPTKDGNPPWVRKKGGTRRYFRKSEELLGWLKELEWRGGMSDGYCPMCGGEGPTLYEDQETYGHKPNCELAMRIKELQVENGYEENT